LLNIHEKEEFKKLVEFYSPIINQHTSIAELNMWRHKVITEDITLLSGYTL